MLHVHESVAIIHPFPPCLIMHLAHGLEVLYIGLEVLYIGLEVLYIGLEVLYIGLEAKDTSFVTAAFAGHSVELRNERTW